MSIFPIDSGDASWGSTIESAWSPTEQISASGRRRAVITQLYPKWTFNCTFKALSDEQVDNLLGFYNERKGGFEPFYYKDYTRHRAEKQTLPKTTQGAYRCIANIGGYAEPISKVENLVVYVDGVATTDYVEQNGLITIATNGTVKADYDYYFYVHFTSNVSVSQRFENINSVSLKLESVR